MKAQGLMDIDKVVVDVKEVANTLKQLVKLTVSFVLDDEKSKNTLFELVRMQGQMVNVSFETRQIEISLKKETNNET